ncbi:MAG: alcohol dehydrogenase catalytic domain-containing protein [Clostridia bacterium]|nr:alcohol dehydrogenase catalytic domain-containing protein [Clostridia bacterium]
MKAIVIQRPGEVVYEEVAKPQVRPVDVLVKVRYAGICGTDLEILDGKFSLVSDGLVHYPVRIGHEWSGIVEEVGSQVHDFKPGDRVISDNWASCGECDDCLSGNFRECKNARALGTCNAYDGAFAEYECMPWWHFHIVPDTVPLDAAAVLEPATIANNGIVRSRMTPDSNVLVMGTGPIGLAAVGLLRCKGCKKIILAGRRDNKLAIGRQMGADVLINMTKEDLKESVMRATDGKGADVVLEVSGAIPCVHQSIEVAATNGVISLISFYKTPISELDLNRLVDYCISIVGVGGQTGVLEVLGYLADGSLDLSPLITHRFTFDQAVDAMRNASQYAETKLKMLVEMPE